MDLSARVEGSDVVLEVRNSGAPITPEAMATIFEPLVRGTPCEPQKQRRPGSIGLGLYIAREVVTAHGGQIDVKSSKEAGTVFTVRLPRRPSGQEAPRPNGSHSTREASLSSVPGSKPNKTQD